MPSRSNSVSGKTEIKTQDIEEETVGSDKDRQQKRRYFCRPVKLFGVEMSPDNVAVSIVYFVQGVLGLARLAVSFYLKDDLHLDPAEVLVNTLSFCVVMLIQIV